LSALREQGGGRIFGKDIGQGGLFADRLEAKGRRSMSAKVVCSNEQRGVNDPGEGKKRTIEKYIAKPSHSKAIIGKKRRELSEKTA
jgi:hypothetical protein